MVIGGKMNKSKSYGRKLRKVGTDSIGVTLNKEDLLGKGFKIGDKVNATIEESE